MIRAALDISPDTRGSVGGDNAPFEAPAEALVRASLRIAAARLVGPATQEVVGRGDMAKALLSFERMREERRSARLRVEKEARKAKKPRKR
jgi:hypothetical protein